MTLKISIQYMKPYAMASAFWGFLGLIAAFFAQSRVVGGDFTAALYFRVFFAFWLLCTLNLVALVQTTRSLLSLASNVNPSNQPFLVMQTAVWGAIKLICLGILVFAISRARGYPPLAWILGLATLLIVPLAGAILGRFLKTEYV